jgi:hypothetical protein
VGGLDEGVGVLGGESGEADAGFAGAVVGGDAVLGAAAEALDVPNGAGVGGRVPAGRSTGRGSRCQ